MPMSNSSIGDMPGLVCRAWAVIDIATLTVKKGFNVSSLGGTSSAIRFNFQAALPNTDYFVTGRPLQLDIHASPSSVNIQAYNLTVNNFDTGVLSGSQLTTGIFYIAVWQ